MEFNINNYVKVKLTEHGKRILKEVYEGCGIDDYEVGVDEDGYTKFQLHDLMLTFGRYMYIGNANLPFDANIIIGENNSKEE